MQPNTNAQSTTPHLRPHPIYNQTKCANNSSTFDLNHCREKTEVVKHEVLMCSETLHVNMIYILYQQAMNENSKDVNQTQDKDPNRLR